MTTRSKTVVHLIGEPSEDFSERVLPTATNVLSVYFHLHKINKVPKKDAISDVVQRLLSIWDKARIPTAEKRAIIKKLEVLIDKYREVEKNAKRGGEVQRAKEADFVSFTSSIFDIAHINAHTMIRIEEDRLFLHDQRTERKMVMGTEDKTLAKKEQRAQKRKNRLLERLAQEKGKDVAVIHNHADLSVPSSSDCSEKEDDNQFFPVPMKSTSILPKRRRLKAIDVVSPLVASALDRTGISDRQAVHILAVTRVGDAEAKDIALSRSSVQRARKKHRSKKAADIKESFQVDGPLVVHFDGKLLPAIDGSPEKEDRVAILVSGLGVEKLLGVPKVKQGTGKLVSEAVANILKDWRLTEKISAMSFDTTAANTGHINGTCAILEKKLSKKLLWLACRHHILEVICAEVFKKTFGGSTTGPDVLLFKRFKTFWPKIRQAEFSICHDVRLEQNLKPLKEEVITFCSNILQMKDNSRYLPREDYKELLTLNLIFLGGIPPLGVRFRVPGAYHHARWMSKIIYIMKIYLFRHQFKLTKHEDRSIAEFAIFASLVYIKAWIQCPIPADAPLNDLDFIKLLIDYKDVSPSISQTALKTIGRHLWYLSAELIPLVLFSQRVSVDEKNSLAACLRQLMEKSSDDQKEERCIRSTNDPSALHNVTLKDFVTSSSLLFFNALLLPTNFLMTDASTWQQTPSFQKATAVVSSLKVVNDCAERGIALASSFNSSLTKSEEEKQYLLQIVEQHRKEFPDAKKSTVLKRSQLEDLQDSESSD